LPTPKAGRKPGIDPALDDEIYQGILRVVNDAGKMFERMPTVYDGKDEESLRDHILMMLGANFVFAATGETFNKAGKTDILLRHENNNVFVAECKFWSGQDGYFETIDQLLNNLVWRDSKAAAIMFVPNEDMAKVLDTVHTVTPNHTYIVRELEPHDRSWLNYNFHLPNAESTIVKMAVMLYHVPRTTVKKQSRAVRET
jgi:hypothetical protein